MQVQIRTASEERPAMQMWEWFDLWQFHQVADRVIAEMAELGMLPFDPGVDMGILDEGSRGEGRLRRKQVGLAKQARRERDITSAFKSKGELPHPSKMSPQDQHHFYTTVFKELAHDHSKMSKKQSDARIAHVDQWRKTHLGHTNKDIKDNPSLLSYGGHDYKSAAAAKLALNAITGGGDEERARRRRAMAKRLDPESVPKLDKKERRSPEAHARMKSELDAVFAKHAYTRPGEDVSSTTTAQEREIHKRLQDREHHIANREIAAEKRAREKHAEALASGDKKRIGDAEQKINEAKSKARELDINHKHNFARIAADTDVPEHEVRAIHSRTVGRRKGAHMQPIRELARIGLRKAQEGTKLSHGHMGGLLGRIMRNIHQTAGSEQSKMDFLRGAVARGGAKAGDEEGSKDTAIDAAEHVPGQTRAAERSTKNQPREKIHHPDSPAGKASPHAVTWTGEHHAALMSALKEAQKKRGKKAGGKRVATGDKSSVDVKNAIDVLYKHGGHSNEQIAKMMHISPADVDRHLDWKTGGGGQPGQAATSGKRAGAKPKPEMSDVEKKAHRKELGASDKASHAVLQDLHYLYPRRKQIPDTALGRALLGKEQEAHNKEFADKVHDLYHGAKTSSGETIQLPKPHQKSMSSKERKEKNPVWDHDEKKGGKIFGASDVRPGFQGRLGAGPGDIRGIDVHPGPVPEGASAAQAKKHQAKLDKFHDTLAHRHEAVHKVMAPIIRSVTNPRHDLTQQWYEHHNALQAAIRSGDEKTVAHLKAEGAKKNIHDDLLAHHLNHAADEEKVQRALGIDPTNAKARNKAANALSNIMRRIQTHGRHWMTTAQAHGLSSEKAKAHKAKGGRQDKWRETPPVTEPQMVKVPQAKSGAGGIIGTPGHKPEQFVSEKPGKGEERAKIGRAERTKSAGERAQAKLASGKPSAALRARVGQELAVRRAKKTNVRVPTAGEQPGVKVPGPTTEREPEPKKPSVALSRLMPRKAEPKPEPHPHQSVIDRYHAAKRDYDALKGREGAHMRRRRARQALAIANRDLTSRGLDPHNLPGSRQKSAPATTRSTPEEQSRQAAEQRRQALVLGRGQRKQAEREEREARRAQRAQGEREKGGQVAGSGRARGQGTPSYLRPARPAFEALLVRAKLVVNESKEQSLFARLGLT